MNLSTLQSYQNQSAASVQSGAAGGTGSVSNASGQANAGAIQAGGSIQGEIVSVKGNDIVLALENGSLLNARLDKGMQLSAGQIMTFEVKSNTGTRLALSPLYENMGQNPNILKALTAAGMPTSAKNMDMVSGMMKEGLPVDKNSLFSFGRQMALNPTADPVTLAQMNRLQIPVTPENIAQFEAYKNYEHQISASVLEITDGLTDTFSQMMKSGDVDGAVNLYKQVLSIFTEAGTAKPEQATLPEQAAFSEQTPGTGVSQAASDAVSENQSKAVTVNSNTVPTDLSGILMEEMGTKADTTNLNVLLNNTAGGAAAAEEAVQNAGKVTDTPVLLEMTGESREQLAGLLKEAGFSGQLTDKVAAGNLTQTALLQEIAKEISEHQGHINNEKLAQVFNSKEYGTLIKNEISRQWLLKPEEVAGDRQVEELYRRLNDQTSKLTNALSQAAKADTPLANTVNNLSNNLNFVNQLNQMFTYIQLPLKMNGENTHGELYVYTNKKNLAKKDGNVSALLHLDMEHLGPVDVYVAMQNHNVSTKFYLQDDSMIDFIADHIHILDERLNKRGYSMNCEFVQKGGEKTPMEEMLESNKNVSVLASYSFDARA